MTQTVQEVDKALLNLTTSVSGVKAALLVSSEGAILGSSQSVPVERMRLSGVSAASVAIARKAARDLNLGDFERSQVKCKGGSILLTTLGAKAVLALVVGPTANPDVVLSTAQGALRQLETLL
jgi:predicted regulator of Ras-like GTPase activity (Roadblock/LC7/MglB family)